MNKKEIVAELRKKTNNSSIRLPKNIDFTIKSSTLEITLSVDGVVQNMQNNDAAFEGWAHCLKTWLRENITKVKLTWDANEADKRKNSKLHYFRFLYRVNKFLKYYSWASTDSYNFSTFDSDLPYLAINYPNKEAKEKTKDTSEASLERKYVEQNKSTYDILSNQLPTGIFEGEIKKSQMRMPALKSQIDIWGLKDGDLTLFELKKDKNTPIGIVTELMFYVNIISDVCSGKIKYPKSAETCFKRGFDKLYYAITTKNISSITGCFLCNNMHALINDDVITTINEMEHLEKSNITLRYTRKKVSLN